MSEITKEYAKALFELAEENSKEKEYEDALSLISDIFSENPQYVEFLSSPSIPLKERIGAIEEAFSGKMPLEIVSFVKLLCEKRYIKYFSQCAIEYKNILNEINNYSTAKVISAVELSEQEKISLHKKLEKMSGRLVLCEYEIDKDILGGLIVEIDGKTYNSSIKGQLDRIKDVIGK